jgi:predicted nucleotidyltransferase component of viral defense system
VIGRAERERWAAVFEVTPDQIERDHVISHLLDALASEAAPEDVFYGGTALCRSHLRRSRLSEDVDLLHPEPRRRAERLEADLRDALRRELPELTWTWSEWHPGHATALVADGDVAPIRVDIRRPGATTDWWEFVGTGIELRYSDLPDVAMLRCPTLESFVGMKMAAWVDRHAPRDLFDLAGLADVGAITSAAEVRYRAATGVSFVEIEFESVPRETERAWNTELGAQVGSLPTADACAANVLERIRALRST